MPELRSRNKYCDAEFMSMLSIISIVSPNFNKNRRTGQCPVPTIYLITNDYYVGTEHKVQAQCVSSVLSVNIFLKII